MNIGTNIKQIRELKNLSQEHIAHKLGVSQASYARIESGTIIPKIDRLQRIAEILEVDLSTLLSTTNNFVYHAAVNQSGYINNHTNNTIDIEVIRAIIREELQNRANAS
ncbi:hypothetical protein AGMMS49965_08500 [Bacteroidia bacterium]|nr:hypothetical protein AGMMS49965_08500 [Bacteroidia bacterium]